MQNRYTGDIGDFSKLGLLRVLQSTGLSIGLNWYLTPGEMHNGDGHHVDYLNQERFRACDEDLWLALKAIVDTGQREVRFLETDDILRATFFSECLDFRGRRKSDRSAYRSEWLEKSLIAMKGKDVIFADPDNGFIVPSAVGKPWENKYVLATELADYYKQGSTVVYYQHKARRKDSFYAKQLDELVSSQNFPNASGLALKFKTTSHRYYMFIIQSRHRETIEKAVNDLLSSAWGEHFCLI